MTAKVITKWSAGKMHSMEVTQDNKYFRGYGPFLEYT